LAKDFGWLRELAEDKQFTQECQKESPKAEKSQIRYGATFVRTPLSRGMKYQKETFVARFVNEGIVSVACIKPKLRMTKFVTGLESASKRLLEHLSSTLVRTPANILLSRAFHVSV
jgi:hypothetical protein